VPTPFSECLFVICRWFTLPQNLDFDFEKCCSVSLSPINVYVCLVCSKYFQVGGRCSSSSSSKQRQAAGAAAAASSSGKQQRQHDVRGQGRWHQHNSSGCSGSAGTLCAFQAVGCGGSSSSSSSSS
jgi:hypothetical protein